MGNLYSHLPTIPTVKLNSYEEIEEESMTKVSESDQTPVLDPAGKLPKNLTALIDPRSPTQGVSRTPVEVVAERERTRLERARRLRSLDALTITDDAVVEKIDGTLAVPSVTPTGFGFDPRSPTFEYNRTPLALGSDNVNNQGTAVGDSSGMELLEDDTPGKKVYDYEMSVPTNSGQLCRDLRKRLFVAQFNDPITDAQSQDDNKEN